MPKARAVATTRACATTRTQKWRRREASALLVVAPTLLATNTSVASGESSLYDFQAMQYGRTYPLERLRGKAVLVMNVASEWPLQNANYPELRMLYEKYHEQGFEMLAFPANQFGGQAPGSSQEEREWAWRKFGIEFPVMDKVAVKYKPTPQWDGPKEMSPVYGFLKSKTGGSEIEWNYTKFLVDRNGQPVRRYKPGAPLAQGLEEDLKAVLEGKSLPQKQRAYLGAE